MTGCFRQARLFNGTYALLELKVAEAYLVLHISHVLGTTVSTPTRETSPGFFNRGSCRGAWGNGVILDTKLLLLLYWSRLTLRRLSVILVGSAYW